MSRFYYHFSIVNIAKICSSLGQFYSGLSKRAVGSGRAGGRGALAMRYSVLEH